MHGANSDCAKSIAAHVSPCNEALKARKQKEEQQIKHTIALLHMLDREKDTYLSV